MQADHVIVRARSAGCMLADYLTGSPGPSVLLIEAGGGDWYPKIQIL